MATTTLDRLCAMNNATRGLRDAVRAVSEARGDGDQQTAVDEVMGAEYAALLSSIDASLHELALLAEAQRQAVADEYDAEQATPEACKGFEIEPGVFSGCDPSRGQPGDDCPVCHRGSDSAEAA